MHNEGELDDQKHTDTKFGTLKFPPIAPNQKMEMLSKTLHREAEEDVM